MHEFNARAVSIQIAYTFDAGQNGVIFGVNSEALEAFRAALPPESIEQIIPFAIGDGPRVIN